jgi:hypothetical protein
MEVILFFPDKTFARVMNEGWRVVSMKISQACPFITLLGTQRKVPRFRFFISVDRATYMKLLT